MKTNSYVEAVKMSVKKVEELQKLGFKSDYYQDNWRTFFINPPKIFVLREI